MKLYDAHSHLGSQDEILARISQGISTFLCGTNPEDSRLVEAAARDNPSLIPTYGLHPWYSDRYQAEEMLPFIQKSCILGEIGMDRIWCDVSLERQREAFVWQLDLAQSLSMPVILHTKGQEEEILNLIRPYTIPFLVHWYSCEEHLEGYLAKDCFFTIGPDVGHNKAVQKVVDQAAADRLLAETDGLAALEWAFGAPQPLTAISDTIKSTMEYIARAKGIEVAILEDKMESSFNYLKNYRSNVL